MAKHILDEQYKGHETVYIQQDNGWITVDVRIDDYDGEFIAGYTDMQNMAEARQRAHGYIDGYQSTKGYIATRGE